MEAAALAHRFYTVEEYLELEETSNVRHEFYEGELFPIEATTANHNRIKRNCF